MMRLATSAHWRATAVASAPELEIGRSTPGMLPPVGLTVAAAKLARRHGVDIAPLVEGEQVFECEPVLWPRFLPREVLGETRRVARVARRHDGNDAHVLRRVEHRAHARLVEPCHWMGDEAERRRLCHQVADGDAGMHGPYLSRPA